MADKTFGCPYCGLQFQSERGLNVHITKSHPDKRKEEDPMKDLVGEDGKIPVMALEDINCEINKEAKHFEPGVVYRLKPYEYRRLVLDTDKKNFQRYLGEDKS